MDRECVPCKRQGGEYGAWRFWWRWVGVGGEVQYTLEFLVSELSAWMDRRSIEHQTGNCRSARSSPARNFPFSPSSSPHPQSTFNNERRAGAPKPQSLTPAGLTLVRSSTASSTMSAPWIIVPPDEQKAPSKTRLLLPLLRNKSTAGPHHLQSSILRPLRPTNPSEVPPEDGPATYTVRRVGSAFERRRPTGQIAAITATCSEAVWEELPPHGEGSRGDQNAAHEWSGGVDETEACEAL